jgi:hypothetical protein
VNSFEFIEGVNLSNLCDYSFGDQSSIICNVPGGWMKPANLSNQEFINKLNDISKERNYMTLFIDNIRLYKREIILKNEFDQNWVNNLMNESNLLSLCSNFSNMNFIIYTNLEDTPIDSHIKGLIPDNVLKIYAVNSIYNDDKVIPFPYGIQRKLNLHDNKFDLLKMAMSEDIKPINLLYINHNISTNISERSDIYNLFENKKWVLVNKDRLSYDSFTRKIKEHKFMICPIGNAIDCHRNWEVLYLRRVPIMKRNEYLEFLFKDYPVLFVDSYGDINEDILINNEHLYQEALNIDLNKLDLNYLFNKTLNKYLK